MIELVIELRNISKCFGDTAALAGVSLGVAKGERLALVGENGAGKSSLMNVLYGLYQPDSGEVCFDGQAVRLKTPADALARGVGMVHQHFTLVPTLSVVENVVLGKEPTKGLFLDLERAREDVARTCRRLGFEIDLEARVDRLSVGSQQKAEIVKALHRGATTLILDEPTAVLTPQEADELFQVTRALSGEGVAVVLISHKLKEVLSFATRIAVMRRGRKVAEMRPSETSEAELAGLMVGDGGQAIARGGAPTPTQGGGRGTGPFAPRGAGAVRYPSREEDEARPAGVAAGALEAPLVEARAPSVEAQLVEAQAPPIEAQAPLVGAQAPPVEAQAPLVGAQAPSVEARAPSVETQAPPAEAQAPSVGAQAPLVEVQAPSIEPLVAPEARAQAAGATEPTAARIASAGLPGPPALVLEHLDAAGLHDVSLEVRAGEILGVAGVDGNGQRELAEVVTGLRPFTRGRLLLRGEALEALTPLGARRRGVAHIPEDRLARALIAELTVEENVALGRQRAPPFARGHRIDFAGRKARAQALLLAHDVRPPDGLFRAGALSGGNQQKLVVGRELDGEPKLLVVVQPTRGLDVAAVQAVRARLVAEKRRGAGVLLVSLDLDELTALADRLIVLFGGRVQATLSRAELDDERAIGRHMLGVTHA